MVNLTKQEVISLFPNSIERTYPAGQIVIYQGDQPSHMFYIANGNIKYYDIDQNGNEKILQIIGTGAFLPIFYGLGSYTETRDFYSTLDDAECVLIPMDDFRARLAADAQLCGLVLAWFVREAEYIMMRLKSLEKNDAKTKVVEALAYLAARHASKKSGNWYRVNFPLSQQNIADLIGVSRETTSIALKDIEPLKFVRYPKQMIVELNKKRLLEYVTAHS